MPEAFNNQIELLRSQFVAGLPQRAHEMEDLWHRLRYLEWNEQEIKTLHMLAHRLVGSGSSFGFPDISNNAQVLDTYLQEQEALNQPLGGIEREMVDQMVASLVNTLRDTRPNTIPAVSVAPTPIGFGKRLYVVDDDRALSALIATYLQGFGFNVEQFDSPAACIQQLDNYPPDAILMDLGFQGESLQGLDAIEHIKIYLGNLVPIILLSARSDMQARLRALRAGCVNYLTKPIDFSRLVNTLISTINSSEATYRVMIVDDEKSVANYHAEILRHAGMEVITVTQPLESLQHAATFKPDLVILDMHMPKINGIELATLLRQEEAFVVLPIIFVTSDRSESLRNSIESLGVNGILHKPVNIDELVSLVERTIKDTIALKNRIARVTQRAEHPQQITRSYFFGALENELQQHYLREDDRGEYSAIYYIGVDTIEKLYEHYGQTGIVHLHEQFCESLSQIIGTEEQWTDVSNLVMCVLTSNRTNEHHLQRAGQILAHLTATKFEILENALMLDISIGIAYLTGEYTSANSVLLQAEQAYEKARNDGSRENKYETLYDKVDLSDRVDVYDKIDNNIEINKKHEKENKYDINFEQGLPVGSLAVSYQPMISLESQHIEHYEALVRWRNQEEELIPAAKFLHYIEHSAMRIDLDRWVLQTAVNAVASNSSTRENATLFIHLSEETLQQKSFFSFAANVLHSSRLRGEKRIVFMLSEHWINNQKNQANAIIKSLRDIRCGVCLTYTGATEQSEAIIQEFKFDFVKLAPTLTTNLNNDTLTSLKKITAAAKEVNSPIIATQVEDSKNLSTLWLEGVRLFQGFFIQTPEQQFNTHSDMEFYEVEHKKY